MFSELRSLYDSAEGADRFLLWTCVLLNVYLVFNPYIQAALRQALYILVERATLSSYQKTQGFFRRMEEITPEWVESRLQYGTLVDEITVTKMGDDMGNASLMFRIKIVYSSNPYNVPDVLILKSPKDSFANRLIFATTKMFKMETLFYTKLNDDFFVVDRDFGTFPNVPGLHVPRSYGGKYGSGGNHYILMEDVSAGSATFTTERDDLSSMIEAEEIVRGVARFHAPYNDSVRFEKGGDLDWVIFQSDPIMCMTGQFMNAGWKTFVDRLELPDEIVKNGRLLLPIAQDLHDVMGARDAPQTLVHGDCHLENSYFVPNPENEAGFDLGLYDFQLLRKGKGAMDLATYIGGSFNPEMLAEIEPHTGETNERLLLRVYLDEIAKLTGDDRVWVTDPETGLETEYTIDDLERDYVFGLALMFIWNVAACLAVPFDSSAAEDYDAYAGRLVGSVLRNSAINHALSYFGDEVRDASPRSDSR